MKLLIIGLVFFITLSRAKQQQSTETDIDDDALLGFSLLRAQIHDGHLRDRAVALLPELTQNTSLTYKQKSFLLTSNGFDRDFANDILQHIMPVLKSEGKTTQETIVTLLFLSKTVCKNATGKCSEKIDYLLPLLRSGSVKGCDGKDMVTLGNTSAKGEMCVCDEQIDSLFWINMYEQLTQSQRRRNTTIPDQFPLVISLLLDELKCDGHLKHDKSFCSCQAITKGNDGIFLQYLITSEDVQKKLTTKQRKSIREALGIPRQRIFGSNNLNVNDYLLSILAPSTDPSILSLLANQGAPSNELLRQLILSSIGLDTSLLHVILNGGFGDDPNRVALISYMTNLGVLDASILPFILGVENGQQFFLSNLVEAGQIDPTTALLLLGRARGFSNDQILGLLISAIGNADNPDFISSIGRPFIPPLPEGVFPGSRLFFPHFESLGVNTCALHDLRNRFECGYIGISAGECETVPYCCYSPVFLTDEAVRASTNFSITAASAVPWCYYNIFFVYYNTFYLPILRPGEFASPIQCSGLFRFGLQLDPSIAALAGGSSSTLNNLINPRQECGFPGITEFQCVAVRSCCWDENAPFRVPQCYRQNGAQGIAFNYDNIPAAYKPAYGSCNTNPFQLPILYYQRVACHYTLEFHNIGYNLLSFPTRLDCLTKLGCCWEDDDAVIEQYPFTPRCYQRVGGRLPDGRQRWPSNIPQVNQLLTRSGENTDSDLPFGPGFPKAGSKSK